MSMDIFRRKQKLIFWIVTIIIVPSFVLVWGVGKSPFAGFVDPVVAKVGTHSITRSEFFALRQRLQMAAGEVPIVLPGLPVPEDTADLFGMSCIYALLQQADQASVEAADLMVGTYLRYQHPQISQRWDGKTTASLDKAVSEFCLRNSVSVSDFVKGVREWLTLQRLLEDDGAAVAVSPDSAYLEYAKRKTEYVLKRLRVSRSPAFAQQAQQEFSAKSADEKAELARKHVSENQGNPKYREPATWRFQYALVPFESALPAGSLTDEMVQSYFNDYKDSKYRGMNFDDIKEQVRADALRDERDRMALRNVRIDLDPQLRKAVREGISIDDLSKQALLAKEGVRIGTTGDKPMTVEELSNLSIFGPNSNLAPFLNAIDMGNPETRNPRIEQWKTAFDSDVWQGISGRNDSYLVRGAEGYMRLRLLDYAESKPIAITGDLPPQILEAAIADLEALRVEELVAERLKEAEKEVMVAFESAGAAEGSKAKAQEILANIKPERYPYYALTYLAYMMNPGDQLKAMAQAKALSNLAVGDFMPPSPYFDMSTGETGQEVLVLVDRIVPSRQSFDEEAEAVRMDYVRQAIEERRGSLRVGSVRQNGPPMAVLFIGEAYTIAMLERILSGDIAVYGDLMRAAGRQAGAPPPTPEDLAF